MGRVKLVKYDEASAEARAVFDEIQQAFGMVPNLFKTFAHFPPLMRANWVKVKAVMMQGELTRKCKEAIAVVVSKDNSCQYCVDAHVGMLKSVGVSDEELQSILNDIENADFTEKELSLIAFARKANSDPIRVSDEEFRAVREAGATDAEILETLGVMEIFTGFNKTIDSTQIDNDFG